MIRTNIRGRFFSFLFIFFIALASQNCGIKTNDSSGSNSQSSTKPPDNIPAIAPGLAQFNNVVLPIMNSKCMSCHNDPRFGGAGPLTIYNYTFMLNYMSQGPTSVNNNLINKVQNIISHAGGNLCFSGFTQTPCKEFIAWWQVEFNKSSSGLIGQITTLDVLGNVTGYAQDYNNPANLITVFMYIDGPVGTGTSLGSVVANQGGFGQYAGHFYNFALPAAYADGKQHVLYSYGISATASNALPSSPRPYVAYTPRTAGQNYYNANIAAQFSNKCVSCHGAVSYQTRYLDLVSPSPDQGGTATNNLLLNKLSGAVSHGGGNICGSPNGSPCAQIQQWWALEFN